MGKVRVTFAVQKEKCREDGTAYYERVTVKDSNFKEDTYRILMCGKPALKGGQCMPKKCKEMRVIEALGLLDKEEREVVDEKHWGLSN